jgi:hypothetical protein
MLKFEPKIINFTGQNLNLLAIPFSTGMYSPYEVAIILIPKSDKDIIEKNYSPIYLICCRKKSPSNNTKEELGASGSHLYS